MNGFLKVIVWICGMIFIIAMFNSLVGNRQRALFRNFMEHVKDVRQHRPKHTLGLFGKWDLARYGIGFPQTKEGVLLMFLLFTSIILLTFFVMNYL